MPSFSNLLALVLSITATTTLATPVSPQILPPNAALITFRQGSDGDTQFHKILFRGPFTSGGFRIEWLDLPESDDALYDVAIVEGPEDIYCLFGTGFGSEAASWNPPELENARVTLETSEPGPLPMVRNMQCRTSTLEDEDIE